MSDVSCKVLRSCRAIDGDECSLTLDRDDEVRLPLIVAQSLARAGLVVIQGKEIDTHAT